MNNGKSVIALYRPPSNQVKCIAQSFSFQKTQIPLNIEICHPLLLTLHFCFNYHTYIVTAVDRKKGFFFLLSHPERRTGSILPFRPPWRRWRRTGTRENLSDHGIKTQMKSNDNIIPSCAAVWNRDIINVSQHSQNNFCFFSLLALLFFRFSR